MTTPIFLVSLPRSGSTLLQRMLGAHPRIATASEPWLLLPLADMLGESPVPSYSGYSTRTARKGIRELAAELEGGPSVLEDALRSFVLRIYDRASRDSADYFLDKTPRYYLIIDFLLRVFPDSKVILLFRNPLEAFGSMLTTFGSGRFRPHHWYVDLINGPPAMADAASRHGSRVHTILYRDLVTDPVATARSVCAYLGLPYAKGMVEDFGQTELSGSLGDKVGVQRYGFVSTESLGQWKTSLNSPVRRAFARRYLTKLGADVVHAFGENLVDLLEQLRDLSGGISKAPLDLFWLGMSELGRALGAKVTAEQTRAWLNGRAVKLD